MHYTHNLTSKFSALTLTLLEAKRYAHISLMQSQSYQYQANFRYSLRIQYGRAGDHFQLNVHMSAL